MVFPVVMYWGESWTIKQAEHWRIDTFELWCWRRLLWVLWTARIPNKSILKEISMNIHWKDCCWSWSSNILATWWEELHWKRLQCWESKRRRGWQRMKWLDGITDSMDMNLSKLQEIVEKRGAWRAAIHELVKSHTRLSNWTTTTKRNVNIVVLLRGVEKIATYSSSPVAQW